MRRFILTVCFLLGFCCSALAQPRCAPYDLASLSLRYAALTGAEQAAADVIYDGICAGTETIMLPPGTRYDDVSRALETIRWGMPELGVGESELAILYYRSAPEEAYAVRITGLASPDERMQLLSAARAFPVPDLDAWETELALYDALLAGTRYGESRSDAHCASGALLGGEAVCDGYANALSLLCRMHGIPCDVVHGQARDPFTGEWTAHAWCAVSLGGTVAWADPTWDDAAGGRHWYFNFSLRTLPPARLWDGPSILAAGGQDLSWHAKKGLLAQAENWREQLRQGIGRMRRTGEPVELRFEDPASFLQAQQELWTLVQDTDEGLYRSVQAVFEPEQLCLFIGLIGGE